MMESVHTPAPVLLVLNEHNVSFPLPEGWRERTASRAVVRNEKGEIALMHATNRNYYKLPGGGLDEGETPEDALVRECLEEMGARITIEKSLGIVEEFRASDTLHQISYAYTATLVEAGLSRALSEREKEQGFEVAWLTPEQALEALNTSDAFNDGVRHMLIRDTAILSTAL